MRLFRSSSFTKRDVSGPIRTVTVSVLHRVYCWTLLWVSLCTDKLRFVCPIWTFGLFLPFGF